MDQAEEKRFDTEIGEEYDYFRLAAPHHDDLQILVGNIVHQSVSSSSKPKILEIGLGTGITSEAILKQGPNIELLALDNEPSMKEKAQKKLAQYAGRYELKIGDALTFLKGLKDGSFDAVVQVWVIHNMKSGYRSELLKEVYRVLTPQGVFISGDKVAVNDTEMHKSHLDWQLKQFDIFEQAGKSNLKEEWTQHYLEDENPDRILVESKFERELMNIGFKDYNIVQRWYMDAMIVATK